MFQKSIDEVCVIFFLVRRNFVVLIAYNSVIQIIYYNLFIWSWNIRGDDIFRFMMEVMVKNIVPWLPSKEPRWSRSQIPPYIPQAALLQAQLWVLGWNPALSPSVMTVQPWKEGSSLS